jgi:hypothetical protein
LVKHSPDDRRLVDSGVLVIGAAHDSKNFIFWQKTASQQYLIGDALFLDFAHF